MTKNIQNLIFDVNETLLDLTPLKRSINAALEDESASDIWFSQLLHYSLVETITGSYHNFSELATAVFEMNAQKHNKNFTKTEIGEILSPIEKLKSYPEVMEGLKSLKEAGYDLIAFSNGKPEVLSKQLKFAAIDHYFDKILSVEAVQKYKPHPDAYNFVLDQGGLDVEETMMVAAHGWDIAGAQRAGLKTAFIQRPGKFLFPLARKPTMEALDIRSFALKLIKDIDQNKNRDKLQLSRFSLFVSAIRNRN